MKRLCILFGMVLCISAASDLQAGEVILYGGAQKPGEIDYSSSVEVPKNLFEGQKGGTYGIRFSGVRPIMLEESIGFSNRFGKRGVSAFQMDTNLIIQSSKKVAPYVTAGLGFIYTWGQKYPEDSDPNKIAASAFSFGKKISTNYGGGIKLRRVMGALGLSIDVRRYTVYGVHGGTLSFFQPTVGAVFTW
jgi:hypothetical protein